MKRLLLSILLGLVCAVPAFATVVSIEGQLYWPTMVFTDQNNDFQIASDLLDAGGEKSAALLTVSKAGTIDRITWATRTVTTGATMDVRLETMDTTTGDPSGTLFCLLSNGAQIVLDTDDNTQFTTTLTAGCTVDEGDRIALVIVNPSVSPGTLQIHAGVDGNNGKPRNVYTDHFTASWAKAPGEFPYTTPGYSDSTYAFTWTFPVTATSNSIDTGTASDEIGNKFTVNVPARVVGWWAVLDMSTGSDFDVVLYEGSTAIETISVVYAQNDAADMLWAGFFQTTDTLAIGTTYRIVIKPTTTNNVEIWDFAVSAAALMDTLSMGQDWQYTERADAGSWTETTTKRALVGIIVDALDDGTGGGSCDDILGIIE